MKPFDVRRKLEKEPINLHNDYHCPAIDRCTDAWHRALQSAESRGQGKVSKWLRANEAYRNAMPPLDSPRNIRDFVACLTHGMIINAIVHPFSAQLLKAATLAEQVVRDHSKAAAGLILNGSRTGKTQPPDALPPPKLEGCETIEWKLDFDNK